MPYLISSRSMMRHPTPSSDASTSHHISLHSSLQFVQWKHCDFTHTHLRPAPHRTTSNYLTLYISWYIPLFNLYFRDISETWEGTQSGHCVARHVIVQRHKRYSTFILLNIKLCGIHEFKWSVSSYVYCSRSQQNSAYEDFFNDIGRV